MVGFRTASSNSGVRVFTIHGGALQCVNLAEQGSFALSYPLSLWRVDRRTKGGNTGLR
jgi:hypothetical protein